MNKDDIIVEKVLKESLDISEVINEHFLKEFGKLHNISPENNSLDLKQEMIAKKAFFLDVKKKYALHIINKEGEKVDKYDIRGLETRRSDYSIMTKAKLERVLDILIKEEILSPKKLRKYVDDCRDELRHLISERSPDIARPVSFSKKLHEYKMIPSSVKGMLLWNQLEYDYFVPGTRGRQFKIIGIDSSIAPNRILEKQHFITKKNNNIVVPEEEGKLPEYYIIDEDATIAFCWDDRIRNLLNPIWAEVYKEDVAEEQCVKQFEFF